VIIQAGMERNRRCILQLDEQLCEREKEIQSLITTFLDVSARYRLQNNQRPFATLITLLALVYYIYVVVGGGGGPFKYVMIRGGGGSIRYAVVGGGLGM